MSCLSLVHPVEPRDDANTLELKMMVITRVVGVMMTVRLILFFYLQLNNINKF